MKKYLFGLVALILAIATNSFMTLKNNRSMISVEDPLYWFDETGVYFDGLREKGDISTPDTQVYETGCDGNDEQDECERGFTVDKLINSEHPEYGVDPLKVEQWSDMIYVTDN